MIKEKRTEYRIVLLSEEVGWSYIGVVSKTQDKLVNVTSEGIFIESKLLPQSKDILEIVFLLPGNLGNLRVKGIVEWRRWAKLKKSELPLGFAVKLVHTEDSLKIMKAYVIYLKNKQIITVSKRIIDEFFGDGKGPRIV